MWIIKKKKKKRSWEKSMKKTLFTFILVLNVIKDVKDLWVSRISVHTNEKWKPQTTQMKFCTKTKKKKGFVWDVMIFWVCWKHTHTLLRPAHDLRSNMMMFGRWQQQLRLWWCSSSKYNVMYEKRKSKNNKLTATIIWIKNLWRPRRGQRNTK